MKFAGKLFFIAVIAGAMLLSSGCKKKKSEEEPITDQQIEKLTIGTWKATNVTRDGGANLHDTDYSAFTLTLTGSKGAESVSFATAGRPSLSPWPASGTLTFVDAAPATSLTRNDDVLVTYSVTGTTLTMSFQYNGAGFAAREGVVAGLWVFTFTQ